MTKQINIKVAAIAGLLGWSIFLTAACGSKSDTANANANTNSAPTVVEAQTTQATIEKLPVYFEATGSLASDAQTDVAPTVGGKVTAVNFDIGSYVEKGAVLVELDSRDAKIRLEQVQAQTAQLQQNVIQAQSNVQQAETNVQQVRAQLGLPEGTNFDVNQVAEVKTAKAALELAEKEYTRNERLLESGDVARTAFDQRKSQVEQARAQYQSAVNTANQRFQAIKTAEAQVRTAEATVKASQAGVDAGKTQESSAQKGLGDATVRAPISGYISERSANLGEFISTSNKVATIVRTSVLRLNIDIPEQAVGQIKVGQSVSLQTTAYPDRNFAGTVARIAPNLNPTSRTLTVEAEVENGDGLLKPGQFATVRIAQSQSQPAVMIPATAVKTEGDINSVFVVKDGRAEQRTVTLGALENGKIEIKQGVQENEAVVTGNLNQVFDGVNVRQ